jgi:hypothetical protein
MRAHRCQRLLSEKKLQQAEEAFDDRSPRAFPERFLGVVFCMPSGNLDVGTHRIVLTSVEPDCPTILASVDLDSLGALRYQVTGADRTNANFSLPRRRWANAPASLWQKCRLD